MAIRLSVLFVLSYIVFAINAAAIDNSIYSDTPRISSSDDMLSEIMNDCFSAHSMQHCMKEKVLVYLDSLAGFREENARAFEETNIDKVIFERVGRILNQNEFRLELPQTFFQNSVVTYRADRGLDVELPKEEARGALLKKKLLLPVLLLLKLKMKALMPILVALIGLKAMKALVLSKLAITLVVGFLAYQLIQKTGLLGMKMNMAPMAPAPAEAYGVPTTPASSYEAPGWEPAGGPYSRWDPSSASSSQSLAYSAYYPSSSSSSNAGSSVSSSSSGSSSSSSSSSPSVAGSYSTTY